MLSRRDLLKGLGVAGAAAVTTPAGSEGSPALPQAAAAPARFETLTATEAEVLDAVTSRLIPTDSSGPGAREAGAVHYIDRALAGPLASMRPAYAAGLAALDAYAKQTKGSGFAALSAADQDAVLSDVEANRATGFTASGSTATASSFFNLVRAHTIEGTFSDPFYGGNTNFAGWDLIGYPGVRVSAAPAEQQLMVVVPPNHKSAYDFGMFRK